MEDAATRDRRRESAGRRARPRVGPGKENFDVKAGRSRYVFIKEEGDWFYVAFPQKNHVNLAI